MRQRACALVLSFAVVLSAAGVVRAQNARAATPQTPPPAVDRTQQQLSTAESIALPARTVSNSVGVSATLLTHDAVRRIFGKEIANTYAVVQLVVSNRNPDAAFVMHSAYLDVSKWALGAAGLTGASVDLLPYEASTRPNRIASVEARVARNQLLDAQTWSARNWTIRTLTAVGSVASAAVFNMSENTAKYVAVFGGTVVPSVAVAWPDGAVGQLNRISDFGFQTNKVFPKESSDIIVCFFPMDLFLSPGIRQIFVDSPGLFLSPYQILFTRENASARAALGLPRDVDDPKNAVARRALLCFPSPTNNRLEAAREGCKRPPDLKDVSSEQWDETLKLLDYIGRFGANNIPVIVDGVMTVNIDQVPAAIDDVSFDGDAHTAAFWASGDHKATLSCRFCANGDVSIQEAAKLGISDLKVVAGESDEHKLVASFKLTKPIDSGATLHFVISKPTTDPKKTEPIKSTPFAYTVSYDIGSPIVTAVTVDDNKKVTLAGTGFFSTASRPLTLALSRVGGLAQDKAVPWPADATATSASFAVPADLTPGCWTVAMKASDATVKIPDARKSRVVAAPDVKITEARKTADTIVVAGTGLADVTACSDTPWEVHLFDQTNADKGKLTVKSYDSLTKTTFVLPAVAKSGNWTVGVAGSDARVPLK